MSFVLGFDFGLNSIGTALGNTITRTVRPLKAVRAKNGRPDDNALEDLVRQWQPSLLVVGLPLMMDGSEQPLTQRARGFAKMLNKRFAIEVKLVDERLSTKEAKELIFERGGFRALARDKGAVDNMSAAVILQEYFDSYCPFD